MVESPRNRGKAIERMRLRAVHSGKGEHHVRKDIDRHLDFDVAGRTTHVASQPELGLLPEWRDWLDPFDSDHPAAVGPDLAGRHLGRHMRKMVQAVLKAEWRALTSKSHV